MQNPNRITVVVLSGGQDSTTCLALALRDGHICNQPRENIHAVTFDYGQRHRVELMAARTIAYLAGIAEDDNLPLKTISGRHEIIQVPGILKGSSPLVDSGAKVEYYTSAETLPAGLEKTFVPMRNQMFLTLAANRGVVLALEKGAESVDIITGVSQEDYGGYPDCRKIFIDKLGSAIRYSLDDERLPVVTITAPLMDMSKKLTVMLSEQLNGMVGEPSARKLLAHSHTCYNGEVPPCGKCHACLLRAKGYAEAGRNDPLIERLESQQDDTAVFGDRASGFGKDPVHNESGLWYFWDETWVDRQGPFIDESTARRELKTYAENL